MDSKSSFTGIFEPFLKKQPIFKDREVLRHSYTPDELPHREEEIKYLASLIAPSLKEETPSNVLIYGKSGTGKTIVTKFVCSELERASSKVDFNIKTVYINCELVNTQYRILCTLANEFGKNVPFTGWPTDKVYDSFKEGADSENNIIIVVLDEIDRIVGKHGDSVLYYLTRINSELKNSKLSVIGISNDLKFTDYLDNRVLSTLGREEIIFKPYNAKQLEDILKRRAELAFLEGSFDEYVIPLCSALAARDHGDARKALDLLRVSGEVAERENSSIVIERHVRKANSKIESDNIVEAIQTLPTQSKLLLYAVIYLEERKEKFISTGKIYDVYTSLCRYVSIDPLTQRRVSDLISELDLLGILNSKVISKGRYGRTKEIKLEVPISRIKDCILEDVRLSGLRNYIITQKLLL